MSKLHLLFAALALTALSCASEVGAATWEYKMVYESELYGIESFEDAFKKLEESVGASADLMDLANGSRSMLQDALDTLGAEGWELVSVHEKQFVFKRRT